MTDDEWEVAALLVTYLAIGGLVVAGVLLWLAGM